MPWTEECSNAIFEGRLDGLVVDDVDAICPKGLRNYLHDAAAGGQLESTRWLLERGANPDGVGAPWAPLHAAAEMGYIEICHLLMQAGADVRLLEFGQSGGTPLVLALFYGHTRTADLLARDVIMPRNLRTAGGMGRVDLLEELIDTPQMGAEREWYRPHDEFPDWTPSGDRQEILDEALVYAASNGRFEAVRWLLARGARADGMPYYVNAIHVAIYHRHDDILEVLLATGPDLNVVDLMFDGTAAGWAAHIGRDELAARLRVEG